MAKRKTFVTNLGFHELAVAAPSMAAALRAWGLAHNVFQQKLARQTFDRDIIAAAEAEPGRVVRRPIGSKGRFTADAKLPRVKVSPKARKPGPDQAAIRKAEAALEKARAHHHALDDRLARQQETLDRRKDAEAARWSRESARLEAALERARRKTRKG